MKAQAIAFTAGLAAGGQANIAFGRSALQVKLASKFFGNLVKDHLAPAAVLLGFFMAHHLGSPGNPSLRLAFSVAGTGVGTPEPRHRAR